MPMSVSMSTSMYACFYVTTASHFHFIVCDNNKNRKKTEVVITFSTKL